MFPIIDGLAPKAQINMNEVCPCGSLKAYTLCCGHYHQHYNAPTALALMRSRYAAFCLGDFEYIKNTMRGRAQLGFELEKTKAWAASVFWLGLEIIEAFEESNTETFARVEFIARFMTKDSIQCIHEESRFERIKGQWYYVDGTKPKNQHAPIATKIAKNAPCPCKSLKKFKNCHGMF
jgi:SEC-C motif-containing protein